MSTANDLPGFEIPLHRSLTEPILLGGAPRAIAIMNGTLAGAVGLGLRLFLVDAVEQSEGFGQQLLICLLTDGQGL